MIILVDYIGSLLPYTLEDLIENKRTYFDVKKLP